MDGLYQRKLNEFEMNSLLQNWAEWIFIKLEIRAGTESTLLAILL